MSDEEFLVHGKGDLVTLKSHLKGSQMVVADALDPSTSLEN